MRLAEALAARADLQRRIEQLRARIVANARYQEGEEPAEDATALIEEADAALTRLQSLIRRINVTNARLDLGPDGTMTDALAAFAARSDVAILARRCGGEAPRLGRGACRQMTLR